MPLDTGNFRPLSGQISAPSSSLTCFVGCNIMRGMWNISHEIEVVSSN